MANSAIYRLGGRQMSSKLNSGVRCEYMRGGADWGMLTGKLRYGVAFCTVDTVRSISERVKVVCVDALYKSTLPLPLPLHLPLQVGEP